MQREEEEVLQVERPDKHERKKDYGTQDRK